MATSRMSASPGDRSPGKKGSPVKSAVVRAGRSRKNRPKPTATPPTAAREASTAAITETCRGVAPTRRIAAKRCSRRAAASRVAVPMKVRTGKSSAHAAAMNMYLSVAEFSTPAVPPAAAAGVSMLVTSVA